MARNWRRSRWRRSWGRGLTKLVFPVAALCLVAAVIVGALAQVGRASGPYNRTVDRGYAVLVGLLAQRSQFEGAQLRDLLATGTSLDRITFFSTLDGLAAGVQDVARRFDGIVAPAQAAPAGTACRSALADRVVAVDGLRRALEGVLGGRSGAAATGEASAVTATVASGTTLETSDASWATCRLRLRRAPGTPGLASSVWVTDPAVWGLGPVGRFVSAVASSPSLAVHHALAVIAMSTTPSAVSGAGTGIGEVPPTGRISVRVVVADQGDVDEPGVEVQVSLDPSVPAPRPPTATAIVAIGAGRSVT
ncbi:MAG: hypothetical protein ACYDD6_12665, partial [Acidimicrobiales bacterium]